MDLRPSTDARIPLPLHHGSLSVSEIFDSVQGEGATADFPCTFLRLAGCNLRCTWCDTAYTWDWRRYDRASEVHRMDLPAIATRLSTAPRVVITGGEPLLQQQQLEGLMELLPAQLPIEVETNGTLAPTANLLTRVNQWNVSPKLANSGEPAERAIVRPALRALRDTGRAWLKLVVADASDADEAMELMRRLQWPSQRVMLMPLASTRSELARRLPIVRGLCSERDVRLSPRLHVERWDDRRGV
jgi:organic radical activating enzyme